MPTDAAGYAKQVEQITGTPVTIEGRNLIINIGDGEIATKANDEVTKLLRNARPRLTPRMDFPVTVDTVKGQLVLDAFELRMNEEDKGVGSFAKNLAPIKADIAKIIKKAKEEGLAAQKIPHLSVEAGTAVSMTFVDDPTTGKGKPIDIDVKDGDFSKLPKEVVDAAMKLVPDVKAFLEENKAKIGTADPAKIRQFAPAAAIDGDPKTLTDKELAAWMLAQSMESPRYTTQFVGSEVSQSFDDFISPQELAASRDPKLVFETARQIFGDAMKGKIQGVADTTGPDGNKPYLDAVAKSPTTERPRC